MKKRLLAGILTGLLILNLSGCGWVADLLHLDQLMPTTTEPTTEAPTAGLTYVNGVLIVNKKYSVPEDYGPGDLTPECSAAFNELVQAAAAEGIEIFMISGFRSYELQTSLYNRYVARDGQAAADRYSARPGHSEHQTGLAFDLNSVEQYFGETAEGKWLAAHCWEYGFIIRYPQGKEGITGFMYEPWHVRYLGTEIAEKVYNSGLTLEEYLGITSVY